MKAALVILLLLAPSAVLAQGEKRCMLQLLKGSNQGKRQEQFGNNVTVYLGGDVRFRCEGQNVYLGSDSVQIINDDIYMLMGRAFYRDSTLSITADTLTYFVHAPNPQQDEMVQARRDVKITDRKSGSTLTGPSVDFLRAAKGLRDSDEVLASRTATRALPAGSDWPRSARPEPWTITAEYLRGFGQSHLWGGGAVVVDRDSLRVNADSLDVESSTSRTAKFFGNRLPFDGSAATPSWSPEN